MMYRSDEIANSTQCKSHVTKEVLLLLVSNFSLDTHCALRSLHSCRPRIPFGDRQSIIISHVLVHSVPVV